MYHMVEEFAALRLAIVTDLERLQECVLPFPVVGVFFIKEPVGFRPCCPISVQVARGKAVLGLNVDICCGVGDMGACVSTRGSTVTFPHVRPSSPSLSRPSAPLRPGRLEEYRIY